MNKLTDIQLAEIFSLKQQKPFTRYSVIANQYNIEVEELKELLDAYQARKKRDDIFSQLRNVQPLEERINPILKAVQTYGSVVVIGDVHGCFVDVSYLKDVLALGRQKGIEQIIINGDFFDASGTKAQMVDEYSVDVIEELSFARDILHTIKDYGYTQIYMTKGNHDQWMCDAVGMSFQELMNILSPLPCVTTDYPYMYHDQHIIGHLDRYASVPGELALAIVHKTGKNTLVHHDHMVGAKMHDEYKAWGISVGCMVDPDRVWYKRSSFNNLPDWSNGFAIITDDYIDLYDNDYPYLRILL